MKKFYQEKFDGTCDRDILSPQKMFPARPAHKSVWKGMSEEALVAVIYFINWILNDFRALRRIWICR